MSSITEKQLLDLSAETTAMVASYAAMVAVVKGTKPSARVELYSVKVNALITAYRAEVDARKKAESEREELRARLHAIHERQSLCVLCDLSYGEHELCFTTRFCEDGEKFMDCEAQMEAARALLARLKDGGAS